MATSTETEILYLKRLDEYKTVKPYEIMFKLDGFSNEAKQTNCVLEPTKVTVLNARRLAQPLTLRDNGFQMMLSPCSLRGKDFENNELVSDEYLPFAKQCIREALGEPAELHILNRKIRKRNSEFPAFIMERTEYLQPIPSPHCDFSPGGAPPALREIIEKNPHLEGRPFQILNVWRMINGPSSDWPLALCDYKSLDLDADIEECDRVATDRTTESVLLYHNPAHRWYFFEGLTTDEVVVFRNCDSRGYHVPFGLHASFNYMSKSVPKIARQSIEVRVVCFF